ncbi:MAG: oligosaccharide flippase family protein [Candidatus Pacebacteria bacterium]|nr:oligosaccharide flippase family protein [Candidatus Paceibacterota bacterium]MCF7856953.1 oligosaccharide flippase family protein [Candidatus Paceibacterota bacterium]
MKLESFLNIIQKKFHIDIHYLLKNGTIISSSHAFGTLCGFLVSVLLANYIDSTTYGQYKYILAVAGIISAFSLTGAASAVLQSVSKGFDGSLEYEKKLSALWGTPAIIISLFFGGYYIYNDNYVLGLGVILMSTFVYLQNIFILHTSFLNGKKDFKNLAKNQVLSSITVVSSIACIIFFDATSVFWILLAYNGSMTLYQYLAQKRTLRFYNPDKNSVDVSEQALSRHLSVGNIISVIAEYIDKILIFQFLGPYQLAIYAFSVGIPDQIRSINKLINSMVIPRLSTKNDAQLAHSIKTHTRTYVIVTLVITILFWIIAKPLYSLLFPQYVEASWYASIYILILPIIAAGILHGNALQIQKKIKSLYSIRIFDSGLKIFFFVILIPHYGVLGAILSILLSKGATIILQMILFSRSEKDNSK